MEFRDLLKNADVSGAQLARRLGITRSAVGFWCTGKTTPPYDKLPEIAKFLNVSIEQVVECFVKKEA